MHFTEIVSFLKKISNLTDIDFYIVGGCIRDHILGKNNVDNLDITVINDFEGFLDIFIKTMKIERKSVKRSLFNTGIIEINGLTIDIVTARSEIYFSPGSLPRIFASDLETDLLRRDFTVNSIAYDVRSEKIIDPLKGRKDIENKIIRANREKLFIEDPTRIFRYFKYKNRFSFIGEVETEKQIENALTNEYLFKNVSKFRISKEWMLVLKEDRRGQIIEEIFKQGVLSRLFNDNVIYDISSLLENDEKIITLKIFYNNKTETLIKILDTLFNGIKKREDLLIRRMKSENNKFDLRRIESSFFTGNKQK
ncbi:MAG: hypothetical protein COX48_05620 [bacterium (Candidatus Stahlbacteria) CG23_combo_of_CG06-09_8_20_14_all_34_7]|nr:MAG: hypothetical protein COX48_05620 [bacterium (Candidatus Stahlbacteria) CG23_combo_of_CG06-09_8_20_14_all_34_7]